jgi:HAD superfamily hydrolase (TIGR01456 family)
VGPPADSSQSIDGVLLRSATPIPGASESLSYLKANNIPFLLLTNGGGKHEQSRLNDLSEKLGLQLDAPPVGTSVLVQSHTPFSDLGEQENLKEKCVLVMGGDGSKCREVAESYGYKNVVTSADIYAAHPELWPFSKNFLTSYYHGIAQPLKRSISTASPSDSLKIDAVFVYNDPRDWGLDIQLILDVLLSREGILGTLSEKNGNPDLPNHGYLQDGQPKLYFSNPDILWAAKYPLPRLGQGGFHAALKGAWAAVTGLQSPKEIPSMGELVIGKPFKLTYDFAERQLMRNRQHLSNSKLSPLKTVYMVGDNPESDIRGANEYRSAEGVEWVSMLTRTGVYDGRTISMKNRVPKFIVKDVAEAVGLALQREQDRS